MLKDEALKALAEGDMDKLRRLTTAAAARARRMQFDAPALMREVEAARRALGISQAELMAVIGKSRSGYTRLMSGQGTTPETAMRLLAWLGQTEIRPAGYGVWSVGDGDLDPIDGAMHAVWLEGNWRWITSRMTTPQREAAADAVARYSAYLGVFDDDGGREPTGLRWWRDDSDVENH